MLEDGRLQYRAFMGATVHQNAKFRNVLSVETLSALNRISQSADEGLLFTVPDRLMAKHKREPVIRAHDMRSFSPVCIR